jgi:hypothetical protein
MVIQSLTFDYDGKKRSAKDFLKLKISTLILPLEFSSGSLRASPIIDSRIDGVRAEDCG